MSDTNPWMQNWVADGPAVYARKDGELYVLVDIFPERYPAAQEFSYNDACEVASLIAAAPETAVERDRLLEVNAVLLEALKRAAPLRRARHVAPAALAPHGGHPRGGPVPRACVAGAARRPARGDRGRGMSDHTPGPWWVQKDGVTVCPPRPRGQTIICRVAPVHMMRAEREANARLIASAPEMLKALQELDAMYRCIAPDDPDGRDPALHPAWKACKAAIAKATRGVV